MSKLSVRYLMRLDDACPTMDHSKWNMLEEIFDKYDIKPIVAVIPNNEDPKQVCSGLDEFFWDRVRRWRNKGWEIALHGYNHVYTTRGSGIVPLNQKSEFVDLPLELQKNKIRKGIAVFRREGLEPRVWVAPSHSFDENTLIALKEESDIRIISDGIALTPYSNMGFLWIPVQIWRLRRKYCGVWTVCLHPNEMSYVEIANLERSCAKFLTDFTTINYLLDDYSIENNSYWNHCFNLFYKKYFTFKRRVVKIIFYVFFRRN